MEVRRPLVESRPAPFSSPGNFAAGFERDDQGIFGNFFRRCDGHRAKETDLPPRAQLLPMTCAAKRGGA